MASFISSLVDYGCTVMAVELLGFWYVWGSGMGTVTGALVNFSLGRIWVFQSREGAAPVQLFRYSIVWIGYLVLVSWGIYILTHSFHINYLYSKLFITLMLGISYNYPLQKSYVYKYKPVNR